jgi:hypothetical protein
MMCEPFSGCKDREKKITIGDLRLTIDDFGFVTAKARRRKVNIIFAPLRLSGEKYKIPIKHQVA